MFPGKIFGEIIAKQTLGFKVLNKKNLILKIHFTLFCLFFLLIPGSGWGEAKPNGNHLGIGLASKEQLMDLELFRRLAQKVNPAVVNIQSLQKKHFFFGDFHFGMEGTPRFPLADYFLEQGSGSGFFIDEKGYILTSAHVVAGSDLVQVRLFDGTMVKGKLIGMDQLTDIALIKVVLQNSPDFIHLGNSKSIQPGNWVSAIGSPFGLNQTVTVGIVSAKGRSLGRSPYDNFIQIDAAINPGNSGGPLINSDGEAVGINTSVISEAHGIGFAVPIDLVKKLIPQLKRSGRIIRSWLGLVIRDVNIEIKEDLGLNAIKGGSLVLTVAPQSPAEKFGIKSNDVVVEFNHKLIKSSHELPRIIAHTPAGMQIPVKIFRDAKFLEINVILEEIPEKGLGK